MKNKFRVGIVGTGHIAKTFHIPAWKRNKFSKIVSLCDKDKIKLLKVAKKFKINKSYLDIDTMLKNENIDIVDICSTPNEHYKNIISAIKFKKHMLVEKPFVTKAYQAKKIINKLKKLNLLCMCALHQRFRPISQEIKKAIDKKIIGDIYFIKIIKNQFRNIPRHSKVFSFQKLSGGGPLIDLGSHYFDLVSWFINFPKIERVNSKVFSNLIKNNKIVKKNLPFKKYDSEEFALGTVHFKNRITLNFELSYLLNIEKNVTKIEIYGDKGRLTWPNGELLLEKKNGKLKKSFIKPLSFKKASQEEVDHFVSILNNKKKQLIKLNEVQSTVQLIETLYESSAKSKEIRFEKK